MAAMARLRNHEDTRGGSSRQQIMDFAVLQRPTEVEGDTCAEHLWVSRCRLHPEVSNREAVQFQLHAWWECHHCGDVGRE